MKKLLTLLMVILLIVSLFGGCASDEDDATTTDATTTDTTDAVVEEVVLEPITFILAEENPLDSISGQTVNAFKEKVEELSNGSIIIDIQYNAVLGTSSDVLDTMVGGGNTIDMARIAAFSLTSYGGEKTMLLSVPYTFVNREHFWNFATSDLANEFLLEPHENGSGIRGLFFGEEGFRNFFTSAPIADITGMDGLKIRVSSDPVAVGMVEGLGASATVVAYTELYSALQSGVVDGAEQPLINYLSKLFYEVADTMILDGHTLGSMEVIMTDAAYDKLSEEQKTFVAEASSYASEFNRSLSEDAENEAIAELKSYGVNIVEVPDKTAWQAACADIIASSTADNKELYQKILDMQ